MILPPDFPWRRGMTAILPDGTRVLVAGSLGGFVITIPVGAMSPSEPVPDPNDGATLGALLAAVREAYEDPSACTCPLANGTWRSHVAVWSARPLAFNADTEFDALLAAWNARPGAR